MKDNAAGTLETRVRRDGAAGTKGSTGLPRALPLPFLLRAAAWLLPEDERGEGVLGDLWEIHSGWVAERGGAAAGALLVVELVRSAPALSWSAAEEHGCALVGRTGPALVSGCAAAALPVVLTGGLVAAPRWVVVLFALLACSGLGGLGGWIAAAVAGAAPRQHALAVGLLLAGAMQTLVATGLRSAAPMFVLALQLVVVAGAAVAGTRVHRRSGASPKEAVHARP